MTKTVLSCIQPTGHMHLGNYFGAVKNYVDLQDRYQCNYGVVDYHAITMPYDLKRMRTKTWDLVFDLIAVGVAPDNLFVQSLVPEHTELCWILNCFCSYGQLTRMTQFKDKSQEVHDHGHDAYISAGLLDYPVLQAADILVYRADYVPIGRDQIQHLELTRDIAQRFNSFVGKEYFVLPEPLFTETPKIKSTADPKRKMSKSAGDKHWIGVFSEEAKVRKQIKSAVTDTGQEIPGEMSDGIANLFEIYRAAGGEDARITELRQAYTDGTLRYAVLKEEVGEALILLLRPFQERRKQLLADKRAVKDQVKASSVVIRQRAQETLQEVKDLIGMLNVKAQ